MIAVESWLCGLQRIVAFLLLSFGLDAHVRRRVLAASGGSFYYVLTGLALIASGALIWRGDARGVWLYGAMLIWTVAWSIWEVGFIGWQLAPRLIAPFVLAAMLLLPPIRKLKLALGRTLARAGLAHLRWRVGLGDCARRHRPCAGSRPTPICRRCGVACRRKSRR